VVVYAYAVATGAATLGDAQHTWFVRGCLVPNCVAGRRSATSTSYWSVAVAMACAISVSHRTTAW